MKEIKLDLEKIKEVLIYLSQRNNKLAKISKKWYRRYCMSEIDSYDDWFEQYSTLEEFTNDWNLPEFHLTPKN